MSTEVKNKKLESTYNIISSEDKIHAIAKEMEVIGSNFGGMVAGVYVASLACIHRM